jgi:hypothetical protein
LHFHSSGDAGLIGIRCVQANRARHQKGEGHEACARHQKGSLQRVKRKSGEAVWIFRWYEVQLDGAKRYRKAVIGSVQEYKTEAEAQRAADALRLEINEQTPRQQLQAISMETLVEHY